MLLFITAQIPAIFSWTLFGLMVRPWFSLLVVLLHFILIVLSYWSAIVIFHSIKEEIERRRINLFGFYDFTIIRSAAVMSIIVGMLYVPIVHKINILTEYLGPNIVGTISDSMIWGAFAVLGES